MILLRRLRRLVSLVGLALAGLMIEVLVFPWLAVDARRSTIARWSALLLKACGIRLVVHDDGAGAGRALAVIAPGRMLAANHVSWLDIFAINAVTASAFVAKAELRSWPVICWLVALAGTVFIERGRRHAVRAVIDRLAERIRAGYPVALFPEATTHAGPGLLPFHGNLFEAAIATRTEIVPIAIDYRDSDGGPGIAAHFVGETTFAQSLWAILGAQGLVAQVQVLAALSAADGQRHQLARELQARISLALGEAGSGSETAGGSPGASH
jgi:1-acyl-sn-glycerol-3-phosphate acyltransferase